MIEVCKLIDKLSGSSDVWIRIVTIVIAFIAFLLALHQYTKAQGWQRAEFIIKLIDSFEKDKLVKAARFMLDMDCRTIKMDEGEDLEFCNAKLIRALEIVDMDEGFTKEQQAIRDAFDAFFDFFQKLYSLLNSNLIKFNNVTYWNYWFEILSRVGTLKGNNNYQKLIDNYIEEYKFIGIHRLIDKYNKNPDPLLTELFEKEEVDKLEVINNRIVVVLMPFEEKWSGEVYEVIKNILVSNDYEVRPIYQEIDNSDVCSIEITINEASFIIAGITHYDENDKVIYGLNMARSIEKKAIIIPKDADAVKNMPSNLRELVINYENHKLGLIKLRDEIMNRIEQKKLPLLVDDIMIRFYRGY